MKRHQAKFNAHLDSVSYDAEKDQSVISGWCIDKANRVPALPAADQGLPEFEFKPVFRPDICDKYMIRDHVDLGFSMTLPGDWTERADTILFRSSNDSPDTEYVTTLVSRRKKTALEMIGHIDEAIRTRLGRARDEKDVSAYEKWTKTHKTPTPEFDSAAGPKFSIITPVYNIDEKWLRAFIDSVLNQTYPNWELCIADDCSPDPRVREVLEEYSEKYPQIKVTYRTENGHISRATNTAEEQADGDFLAFMDNDDLLDPNALGLMASYIEQHPECDFVYSDEDKIDEEGVRFDPFFKPDWNPVLLDFHNYITHFVAVRRSLAEKEGMLNPDYDGAQDFDFVRRLTSAAREVGHVPEILYHWRTIKGSVAENPEAKLYAYEAGRKVIEDTLKAEGIPAEVRIGENYGTYETDYFPGNYPKVTVILAGQNGSSSSMRQFAAGDILTRTDYPNFDIIAVNTPVFTEDERIRYIQDNAPRSDVQLRNYAASLTDSELLVFVDDEIRPENEHWLTELVNFAKLEDTGIAGPLVLNNSYRTLGAGVSVENGRRYLPMVDHSHFDLGYYYRIAAPQCVYAVSLDCMLVKKDLFDKLGGFNEKLETFEQDIDLSLRAREAGKNVVYVSRSVVQKDSNINGGGFELRNLCAEYPAEEMNDRYISPKLQQGGSASAFIRY